jgi:hypothetical protein
VAQIIPPISTYLAKESNGRLLLIDDGLSESIATIDFFNTFIIIS